MRKTEVNKVPRVIDSGNKTYKPGLVETVKMQSRIIKEMINDGEAVAENDYDALVAESIRRAEEAERKYDEMRDLEFERQLEEWDPDEKL